MEIKNNDFLESSWKEAKRKKYAEGNLSVKIQEERYNFLFLSDGSFVYDYLRFNDADEAIVDAVVNGGEELYDLISLVYPELTPKESEKAKKLLLEDIAKKKEEKN